MADTALAAGTVCHGCGYEIDMSTGINGKIPDPGDISICWKCGEPEKFIMCPEGLTTTPLSQEEKEEVLQDEVASKVIAAIKFARSIARKASDD